MSTRKGGAARESIGDEEREDDPFFLPAPGDEGLLFGLVLVLLLLPVVLVFEGGVLGVVVLDDSLTIAVAGRIMGDRIDLALRWRRCEEAGEGGGEDACEACRCTSDDDDEDNDNRRRDCCCSCGERRLDTELLFRDDWLSSCNLKLLRPRVLVGVVGLGLPCT